MVKNNVLIFVLCWMFAISPECLADQLQDLEKVHMACKNSLDKCEVQLSLAKEWIQDLNKQSELQQKEIEEYQKNDNSILKSPTFWFVIGIAAGSIVLRTK